ncbi:MAG: hypothetical protein Q9180_002020 [Flavoplaca navasiana]
MNNFMAEVAPDNDPRDVPSASERKAVSDFLHGRILVGEAVFAYTRDTISGKTSGDVWYLIYYIAQTLAETQDRLIELIRAITALPDELGTSGKVQRWSLVGLRDLHSDLYDRWDSDLEHIRVNPDIERRRSFIGLTAFIARLRWEGLLRTADFSNMSMDESAYPGPLLKKAKEHWDVDRWHFWKSRMAVLGNEGVLSQKARDAAKSSLARMLKVEIVIAQ